MPAIWVWVTTMYAALQKMLPTNGDPTSVHDKVSHVATAQNKIAELSKLESELASLKASPDASAEAISKLEAAISKTNTIISNNIIDAVLCGVFMVVVVVVTVQCIRICARYAKDFNAASKEFPLNESEIKDAAIYIKN